MLRGAARLCYNSPSQSEGERMHVLDTLAPVFLVIALGAALRRGGFFSDAFVRGTNRLVYWVGLPCLLFRFLARATDLGGGGAVAGVVLGGMVACVVAAYGATWLLRLPAERVGTLVQGAFRANTAYVGLSVVSLAHPGAAQERAMQLGVIVLAATAPVYNVAAVAVLLASRHRFGVRTVGRLAGGIVTNPIIVACAAGLAFALLVRPAGVLLPQVIDQSLAWIGQFALPLALLGIGAALATTRIRGRTAPALTAASIKVGLGPAVGAGLVVLLGLGPVEARVALIMLACPTATASYVLADQLDGDGPLAAAIVVASTVLSMLSLGAVVALT